MAGSLGSHLHILVDVRGSLKESSSLELCGKWKMCESQRLGQAPLLSTETGEADALGPPGQLRQILCLSLSSIYGRGDFDGLGRAAST